MKRIIIIPARLNSQRLPYKPLLMYDEKALVHWTYEAAKRTIADHVLITSPDRKIANYCQENNLAFYPSTSGCPNGTARCAEVASLMKKKIGEEFLVVNWQCDEPLVDPNEVNELMVQAEKYPIDVHTLVAEPTIRDDLGNMDLVKVVVSHKHPIKPRCLWFSRHPMGGAYLHCGIYAYMYRTLTAIGKYLPSEYAEIESLEQLTWIENLTWIVGKSMKQEAPLSINAPVDWEMFVEMMKGKAHVD